MKRALILFLFFFSGMAALIHEVVWLRLFTLTFGNTTRAGAVVLGAFMAGMALGAWYFGKRSDKSLRPLRLYAYLEIAAALLAAGVLAGYFGANPIYRAIFQWAGPESFLLDLARVIICFALMILPCAAMGGTLPVLVRAAQPKQSRSGQRAGILYGVNTIGAVAGVVVAGFFTIRFLGVYQTAFIAIAGNALAGLIALAAFYKDQIPVEAPDEKPIKKKAKKKPKPQENGHSNWALILAACAGFYGIALEVMYIRLVLFRINFTIYVWAIVLTVFLAGIALGSWAFAKRSAKSENPLGGASRAIMGMAMGAWLSLILFSSSFFFDGFAQLLTPLGGLSRLVLLKFGIVGLTLFLPAFCSGAAFPYLVRAYMTSKSGTGAKVGRVYAANTVAGIIGSLLAGFLVLPFLGAQRGIFWGALALFGAAAYASNLGSVKRKTVPAWILAGIIIALGAAVLPGRQLMSSLFLDVRPPGQVLMFDEGENGTVAVFESGKVRELSVNGIMVGGQGDIIMRTTQILQGHVPMMIHPDPRQVLMVGFGSGETARVLSIYGPENIDAAELCEGVMKAAPYFEEINRRVDKASRFKAIIGDAKNYMGMTDKRYDVILNDSIHPNYFGNAGLYTKEYFQSGRDLLREGGIMSSWVPLFGMSEDSFKMMVNSFVTVFPNSAILYAHTCLNRHALLVGKKGDDPLFPVERMRQWILNPLVLSSLGEVGIDDVLDIVNFVIMGQEGFTSYLADAKIHTDNHPRLEFDVPLDVANPIPYQQVLRGLLQKRENPLPYLNLAKLPEIDNFMPALERRRMAAVQVMLALSSNDLSPQAIKPRLEAAKKSSPAVAGPKLILEQVQQYQMSLNEMAKNAPGVKEDLIYQQFMLGNYDNAKDLLEQKIQKNPKDAESLRRLGIVLLKIGDLDQAVTTLQKAIKLAPKDPETMRRLGIAYFRRGDHAEAAGWFNKAIEAGGPDAELLVQLAMSYERSGDLDTALASYAQAVALDESYARGHAGYGSLLRKKKMYDEAWFYLQKAITLDPNNTMAMGNLALMYLMKGETEQGKKLLQDLLKVDPTDKMAKEILSELEKNQ